MHLCVCSVDKSKSTLTALVATDQRHRIQHPLRLGVVARGMADREESLGSQALSRAIPLGSVRSGTQSRLTLYLSRRLPCR